MTRMQDRYVVPYLGVSCAEELVPAAVQEAELVLVPVDDEALHCVHIIFPCHNNKSITKIKKTRDVDRIPLLLLESDSLVRSVDEGWVVELLARLLATARQPALWIRIQTSLKNTKWAT